MHMFCFPAVGTDFQSQSLPLHLPLTDQGILDDMYALSPSDRLLQPLPVSPPVCTSVSIIDDDILELVNTKVFFLNLSHPDASVSFAQPSYAMVTITDDDSKDVILTPM